MKIGILKEEEDHRVSISPANMKKAKFDYLVQKGAGEKAFFPDRAFEPFAQLLERDDILKTADIIVTVHPLPEKDLAKVKNKALLIALFESFNHPDIIPLLEKYPLTALSMDMIPRTSLAQSMDVLSSMAAIAGYKAVLKAADYLPRYFPMMITAAGSVRPATVLVLGAGVAGLQAIATAKRLGAMVEAFDVRKASKEEVESLGAKFIEVAGAKDEKAAGGYAVEQTEEFLKRQQAEVQNRAAKADVIITTAQVRGRKAPILVPATTVDRMKAGAVIIDLAASTGGNCELSKNDEVINYKGVTIIGQSNLANDMPQDASTLYGSNVLNLLKLMIKDDQEGLSFDHEIVQAAIIAGKPNLQTS